MSFFAGTFVTQSCRHTHSHPNPNPSLIQPLGLLPQDVIDEENEFFKRSLNDDDNLMMLWKISENGMKQVNRGSELNSCGSIQSLNMLNRSCPLYFLSRKHRNSLSQIILSTHLLNLSSHCPLIPLSQPTLSTYPSQYKRTRSEASRQGVKIAKTLSKANTIRSLHPLIVGCDPRRCSSMVSAYDWQHTHTDRYTLSTQHVYHYRSIIITSLLSSPPFFLS